MTRGGRASTPPPKTPRGEETKNRIVAAAARLMLERGVAATSLDDVLAESDAGKGQLYLFFSGKNELVREVLAHQLKTNIDHQRPLIEDLSTWDNIAAWMEAIPVSFERKELIGGCPIGSLAAEMADRDEPLRRALADAFTYWEGFLAKGLEVMVKKGELRADTDPATLAEITMAALQGGYVLAVTKKDIRPMRNSLQAILAYLRSFAVPD